MLGGEIKGRGREEGGEENRYAQIVERNTSESSRMILRKDNGLSLR